MPHRFSLPRHVVIATIALLAAAPAAHAQSRDWSVCYGSGVLSCTDLYLSTTPTLGGAGGARDGTQLSLTLRQRDRGVPTGLLSFTFGFGQGLATHNQFLSTIPTPVGGAQENAGGLGWFLRASRSTNPFGLNYFVGNGVSDGSQLPSPTSLIGGCLSPSSNAFWSITNVACGNGQAFSFQWTTTVFLDADQVQTVGADVLAIDQQALSSGTGGGYCHGPASGGAGIGFDGYDPTNAFPCDIGAAAPLVSTVPEPQTVVLLAGALAILGGIRSRGMRLRSSRARRLTV